MLIRRLALSGDYADTDWTNPATPPPDSVRELKVTSSSMQFAFQGRSSEADDAAVVDVGTLEVDAYLVTSLGDGYVRSKSLVEIEGGTLSGRIKLVAGDTILGEIVRLHLALTSVGALPVLDVHLLSGGRPL